MEVTGEEVDGKEFAKTVEAELMAKSKQIEEDKALEHKASTKRKERLRRLQRLKRKASCAPTMDAQAVGGGAVVVDTASPNGCDHGFAHSASSAVQNVPENTQSPQSVSGAEAVEVQRERASDSEPTYDIFDRTEQPVDDNGDNDGNGGMRGHLKSLGGDEQSLRQRVVAKEENLNLTHNWDDSEGYYVAVPGSSMGDGNRYEVLGTSGKGVYSSVIRVRDRKGVGTSKECVIKVIRNNEMMKKQGRREIAFLREIKAATGDKEGHCICLLDHFWFRNHLCLSFEAMKCDLRRLLKDINISHSGLSISAVMEYTKQLLRALVVLSELEMVHADIKPDNVLVSNDYRRVKLCDFGSSFKRDEVERTPTVGSRYYRAPEIMMGMMWGNECDVWSLACTLFEIYSTRFLFKGASNNEMLLQILTLCGAPPPKLYSDGLFYSQHFAANHDFLESRYDAVAQFDIQIPHKLCSNKADVDQSILQRLCNIPNVQLQLNRQQKRKLSQFALLLSKMLCLNPHKRITPRQALKHLFCTDPIVHSK